jgi:hypothetical protein
MCGTIQYDTIPYVYRIKNRQNKFGNSDSHIFALSNEIGHKHNYYPSDTKQVEDSSDSKDADIQSAFA